MPILFEYGIFKTDIKPYLPHYISMGEIYNTHEVGASQRFLPQINYARVAEKILSMFENPSKTIKELEENLESIKNRFDSKVVAQKFLDDLA